jgi:endogenous inhibitor of DNA gyrase (YacG/DUF329 family)
MSLLRPSDPGFDPSSLSLPGRESAPDAGGVVDFDALLAESRRNHTCAECGEPLAPWQRVVSTFCSPRCRYRFRDRRKYAENPERERERSRRYYAENREAVLARAAAKRGRSRPAENVACSECGAPLEGRQRVICGANRCRDAQFKRLHPESYAEREARKVERRRERRRAARSEADGS